MKQLKSFILGMTTILLFIPIMESICEIICTYLEYIKGVVSKPVLKMNKELLDLQVEQEPVDTVAMGFEYTPQEEYYEDDDFDDKNKVKIGFTSK